LPQPAAPTFVARYADTSRVRGPPGGRGDEHRSVRPVSRLHRTQGTPEPPRYPGRFTIGVDHPVEPNEMLLDHAGTVPERPAQDQITCDRVLASGGRVRTGRWAGTSFARGLGPRGRRWLAALDVRILRRKSAFQNRPFQKLRQIKAQPS